MLVLTRRVGESLKIDVPAGLPARTEITTTILGVNGNQIRIGIDAPKEAAVHREEIYDRIKAEEAGQPIPPRRPDAPPPVQLTSHQTARQDRIRANLRQRRAVNGNR